MNIETQPVQKWSRGILVFNYQIRTWHMLIVDNLLKGNKMYYQLIDQRNHGLFESPDVKKTMC